MNRRLAPLALALATFAAPAFAMSDGELATLVGQRLHGDRTGACFAVAVIDKTVARAFVCADGKTPARIDASSAFEIGSVSKTMTSALLASLIAEGKASLDDPLADYLPKGSRVPAFKGQPILLRHVVTHTSGLPSLPPGMAPRDMANPYADLSERDLLEGLGKIELNVAPGTGFAYSNWASMLLSMAVARRAGSDFEGLLDQRLFTPLGMDSAYINQAPAGVRAATGHLPNGKATSAWTFKGDAGGVGGVRATLEDMVRYVQGQLGQRESSIASALKTSQQPLETAAGKPMAMNWMLAPLNGSTLRVHEGGTGGFSSFVAFDPVGQRGVVILSDTAVHSLGGLSSLGVPLLAPGAPMGKPRREVTAPDDLLDALVGQYQLQGAMRITLSRKGNALVAQAEGQPAFELGYDDAGDFYPRELDALLKPQRLPGGGYGFTWFQGGGAVPATRIDAAPRAAIAAPSQLGDYEGVFRIAPPFAITVFAKDGKLFAQGTGQGPLEIEYAAKDVFVAAQVGAEMQFERNAEGKVMALLLKQGGAVQRGARE